MRIATIGIALGMAVMIIAIGTVTGFQNEIREKVLGFGAHIQVTEFGTSSKQLNPKLSIQQAFYPSIDTVPEVKNINLFALKEGVIETPENIQGILAKGVAEDYDWTFIQNHLEEGEVLHFSDSIANNQLLISSFLVKRLKLSLGDKVPIYFQNAKNAMSQRNFTIVGIFDTGLREMDEEFVFIDIEQIRKINQWGLNAYMSFEGCRNDSILLSAKGFGSDGDLRIKWNVDSLRGSGPHAFCPLPDQTIYAVVTDRMQTIGDTAFFKLDEPAKACGCNDSISHTIWNGGGSAKYYTGGFEITLDGYESLETMNDFIYEHLNYDLNTTTIKQHLPEIFNWLEMLDLNTYIIIVLMIFISIINMTSALLILIMERTNMIGLLKALGATSWAVQKIFLYQAAYIISIGLLIGNAIGIGLSVLQMATGFAKLDPENYYVSEIPVLLDINTILILNFGTLIVCLIALILPSLAVTQIRPSKAIRYN